MEDGAEPGRRRDTVLVCQVPKQAVQGGSVHGALAPTVPGTPHAQATASRTANVLGSLLMHALGCELLSYPSGSAARQRRVEVVTPLKVTIVTS
jgi:hypothetical protein